MFRTDVTGSLLRRQSAGWAVLACAILLLTGCADGDASDSGSGADTPSDRPLSQNPPPTLPQPSKPPTSPSDPIPVGLIVGRIVADSSGPCYLVENDDGQVYAVRNAGSGRLTAGTTVRVQVSMNVSTSDCPGGIPVRASVIEKVE